MKIKWIKLAELGEGTDLPGPAPQEDSTSVDDGDILTLI